MVQGKGSLPDGKAELEAEELLLTSVSRHHAGVYRCTAFNGFGSGTSKVSGNFLSTNTGYLRGTSKIVLYCTVQYTGTSTVTELYSNCNKPQVRPCRDSNSSPPIGPG